MSTDPSNEHRPPSSSAAPGPSIHSPAARPASSSQCWTTRSLLAWMRTAFERAGLEQPRLYSESLLSHTLGCERLRLYMDADRPATAQERDLLRSLVSRALSHEPVQYLVGEAWFYSLPLHSDRRALIPRPSTEILVEEAVHALRAAPWLTDSPLADVCTGSGAVAIAALKNIPSVHAVATDISPSALELARTNAARHGVSDRVEFLPGDLLAPLKSHPACVGLCALLSNPPYIPDTQWAAVPPTVKEHEPTLALRGGADGLDLVRPLLSEGPDLLRPGGLLAIELASVSVAQVLSIADSDSRLKDARIRKDSDGLPRALIATRA